MAKDDLVAKSLRENCMNKDVRRMIDFPGILDTLDTCYRRPKKTC